MSFTGSIALVLMLSAARVFFGDSSWFQFVRLIAFFSLPWVLAWRLWMLYRLQIRPRRGVRK